MITLHQGDCRDVLPTLPACSVHTVVTSPPYYGLRSYGVGAENGELGSDASPEEYIATMLQVFREIRRVMRDDAVAFVNMGDSYRDKQLLMMPARLALALQADGWWLRSDIIISKRNPMPESVTDRCTSAHEHLFMLTKSPRYYFDAIAIRESVTGGANPEGNRRTDGKMADPGNGIRFNSSFSMAINNVTKADMPTSRNCRDVWEMSTFAFKDSHFATFSPELPERCIRAGTSERGCCAACGAPWVRGTVAEFIPQTDVSEARGVRGASGQKPMDASSSWQGIARGMTQRTTTGWSPSCFCCRICDEQRLSCVDASQRPDSRERVAESLEQAPQSGPGAQCENKSEPEQAPVDLQALWESGSRQEGRDILQQGLLREMDVGERPREPFPAGRNGAIQREERQRQDEVCPSADNGAASWQGVDDERARSSSERHQRRQPDRESGRVDSRRSQKDAHDETKGHKLAPYPTKPATVLDCFAGAGTVGLVADRLQRDAVLIELNPAYCEMLRKRITSEAPLFANVVQPHDEDPEDMFQADLFLEAAQ